MDQIRSLVLACGVPSDGRCTEQELATLYACGAIILAGAEGNHAASVQAFRRALSLDPSIALLPEYQIAPVISAYYEAKGILPPPRKNSSPAVPSAPFYEEEPAGPGWSEQNSIQSPREARHRAYFLLGGGARCCAQDGPSFNQTVAPGVGASALIGINPAPVSGFAMALQMRAYGYLAEESWFESGAAMLLGSVVGPRQDDTFSFFFGGLGVGIDTLTATPYPTLHFIGGTSIRGLMLGGSMLIGANYDTTYVLFGLEVGWGKLL